MSGRLTWTALALSLTLNIFILGAVVGGGAAGLRIVDAKAIASVEKAAARPALPMDPRRIMRDLPPDRRKELRQAMGRNLVGIRPIAHEARRAREGVYKALSAEPFDSDALLSAVANASEKEAVLRAKTNEVFAEFYTALTPEERALFRDRIEQRPRRGDRELPNRLQPPGNNRGDGPPPGP